MNELRRLPAVTQLLRSAHLAELVAVAGQPLVLRKVQEVLHRVRQEYRARSDAASIPSPPELVSRIAREVRGAMQPVLRPVINATGVLLHTGLGRAPLAEEAVEVVSAVSRGYASLEVDLESGRRSQRNKVVEALLQELTGADAALVVNNNAAATILVLASLASGREVVVSRGQLIEIGGQFRLPEVMATSGARLREVGTTNKTRLADYAHAMGPETGALLLVHTSNFKIVGFSEQVTREELVALGHERAIPVIHDIGSGALLDLRELGCGDEPVVSDSIKAGADIVMFSGDKLLGGPQCGIVLGRGPAIEAMARHPLARAFRVDKMTLAALDATLRLYRDPQRARDRIPLLRFLSVSTSQLAERAEAIARKLERLAEIHSVEVADDWAYVGGGSIPAQRLATVCVALQCRDVSLDHFAQRLRLGSPPVVGRMQNDRLLLDLRSVFPAEDDALVDAVRSAAIALARDGEAAT